MIRITTTLAYVFMFFALNTFAQDFKTEIEEFRENYKEEFLKSKFSPVKKEDFQYLRFYEPDEKYRVECQFTATAAGKPFKIPTTTGETRTYTKFGELTFRLDGKNYTLAVYRSPDLQRIQQYRDYLFIPFKDQTNGKDTYGGGRYIDLRMNQLEKDVIILDFNKAYNPYCAFGDGFSCPIPPRENHLKVPIEAGEKNYAKIN
ncbi:DUF1684 domain-containing protein [Emticicia sp. TH156]|uniref:DUF1684 domain-containing protein n=1 Tax=Emticicia sp. TH156 TaxID=2067454 RepID=UPI000C779DC8|nr:DUF1684 domain-containing protein [Emticicia sp. TH156]PLK42801.1 hypothetical protein C0V77_19515 [Emticicia sp. TH156]